MIASLASKLKKPVKSDLPELPVWGDDWLSTIIRSQDAAREEVRYGNGYLHVSSLINNFCPRAQVLYGLEPNAVTRLPSSGDRIVWSIGKALEAYVRKQLAARYKHFMFGRWSCSCSATKVEGLHKEVTCPLCKTSADNYDEFTLYDHSLRICGNPDILIYFEGKLLVVEIKSIKKDGFDALESPLPNHVFQLNFYRTMLGEQAHPYGIVFYVKKDYDFKSPYKEFHVDSTMQSSAINLAIENVKGLRSYQMKAELPPKLSACFSPSTQVAKTCPVCVSCFNRD